MPDLRRLQKDLKDAEDYPNTKITFPDEDDMTIFIVHVKVTEGLYKNRWFPFKFTIPDFYPNDPPIVQIQTRIWHPNIQLYDPNDPDSGKFDVCPITSNYIPKFPLTQLIDSLKFMLSEESFYLLGDVKNCEAAKEYLNDRDKFMTKCKEMLNEMEEEEEKNEFIN